jgi:acetyl-CoA carboxylase biotin carboxylase subunit
MFKKIFIANRGEIALRIIRACKELGIKTCIGYSVEDKDSIPVMLADEAICVGPAQSMQSYLNLFSLAQAIHNSGADAVHPGYGFLSENPTFVKICNDLDVVFIGPDEETIARLADKSKVKQILKENGIPTIPGSDGAVKNIYELKSVANNIGYPILLKASWGGGGRGMRVVRNENELFNEFNAAQSEAKSSFGREDIYVEKFIEHPRHIEAQVIGDKFGNIVHVGERDCTLQRRHQKVLEESPSPYLDDQKRAEFLETAVKAASILKYWNAGTLEFLFDEDKNFYFIEINTRIQVEHPVSETVYDVDLIKEQIMVAYGYELSFKQEDLKPKCCAIECRINAEDSEKFIPSPGKIKFLFMPQGSHTRVDSHIYCGYNVSPYYDSMIAKLIVSGKTREEARLRMLNKLSEFKIEGIKTNIPFFKKILNSQDFINNTYDTNFIDRVFLNHPK